MRRSAPYRVRITPFARQQLKAEMAYSRQRWGRVHQEAFRHSIQQRVERIAAAPHALVERPELGEGVRVARQGGLLIVFLVNEEGGQVEIVGFPNIHRELGRSVSESLARLDEDER